MLSAETVVACVVVPVATALGGWLASSAYHRRRFVQWQAAYQRQLQVFVQRHIAKGSAEITSLKTEIVRLKAERLAQHSRQRVVDLKSRLASLPRLAAIVTTKDPTDDGFQDTQPFERRA